MVDYEIYNILLSEGYIPSKSNLIIAKQILLEGKKKGIDGTYDPKTKTWKSNDVESTDETNKSRSSDVTVNNDEANGLAKHNVAGKIFRGAASMALGALLAGGAGNAIAKAVGSNTSVGAGVGAGVGGVAGGASSLIADHVTTRPKTIALKKANQTPPKDGEKQKVVTVEDSSGVKHKIVLKAEDGKWVVDEGGKELPKKIQKQKASDNTTQESEQNGQQPTNDSENGN